MDKFSEFNVWADEPTTWGVIVYSVVIPVISGLGIIGNFLILAVLCKKSLNSSTFTYLAVLAAADLLTCVLLLFSGLARGVFWGMVGWREFDAFVHLPIGSVTSNIAVWASVCVTLDRLILVAGPVRYKPPMFCNYLIARKMMLCCSLFAVVFNIPYCFIFTYNEKGEITTTEFFTSRWYNIQNWFQLVIFGMVPAVFLFVGNTVMCFSVKKIMQRRMVLLQRRHIREGKCLQNQAKVTITLVSIVFLFLVGEVPTHLASRRSALSILYGGDETRINEVFMEKFRIVATLLNTISSSANFILYCLLSPHFIAYVRDLTSRSDVSRDVKNKMIIVTIDRQTNDSTGWGINVAGKEIV